MSKCPLLLTAISIFIVINTKAQRTDYPNKAKWYREYKFFWGPQQCSMLPTIYSLKGVNWDTCKRHCDLHWNCTAFNWAYQDNCETMNCGDFPPYPIGILKGYNGWWKGFSKYELEFGGRYYGPYGTHWSNAQCLVIGTENDKDRVKCEAICDKDPDCSGFNFRSGSRKCVMINCATTPPVPPSQSKWDWESYSKTPITRPHAPRWKCPSFHCQGRTQDKPNTSGGGCSNYGHTCWGGHGRRGKRSVTGATSSPPGQAQQKALMEVLMAPLLASAVDHDNTNTEHTLVHHTDDTAMPNKSSNRNPYSTGEQEFKI